MHIDPALCRKLCAAIEIAFSVGACATTVSTTAAVAPGDGQEHYVGAYENGLRSGQGTYTWPDGRRFVGTFRNGLPNGSGVYTLPNGETYVGEFHDNLRTVGTYSWRDGRTYAGTFQNDKPDGSGTYTWPDGKKYVGEFRSGRAEGRGTYTWPDGRTYAGNLRDDLPNGRGTLTLANGRQEAGEFINGDYVGTTGIATVSAPPGGEAQLERRGGTFVVPALLNGTVSIDFYLDSGSADVSVPAYAFDSLKRAGTVQPDDIIGSETYLMANGVSKNATIFRIRSLKVGSVVLENVRGSVAEAAGPALLGMSFLGRFSAWSVDNSRSVLVLK
jgi:clan AA aspartic protease (TIGR02281 family)